MFNSLRDTLAEALPRVVLALAVLVVSSFFPSEGKTAPVRPGAWEYRVVDSELTGRTVGVEIRQIGTRGMALAFWCGERPEEKKPRGWGAFVVYDPEIGLNYNTWGEGDGLDYDTYGRMFATGRDKPSPIMIKHSPSDPSRSGVILSAGFLKGAGMHGKIIQWFEEGRELRIELPVLRLSDNGRVAKTGKSVVNGFTPEGFSTALGKCVRSPGEEAALKKAERESEGSDGNLFNK